MVQRYSDDFLISELHRFVNEFNRIPTSKDIDKAIGYPNRKTYDRRFQTFNNALSIAGYKPTMKIYTKEELIVELQRFYYEFGHVPTYMSINNTEGYPSAAPFELSFGSWNNALEAANLEINLIHSKLDGAEICSKCGCSKMHNWCFIDKERVCYNCYLRHRYATDPKYRERHQQYYSIRNRNMLREPMNDYFVGSHFHHLHIGENHAIGIYIPKTIHAHNGHNPKTGSGMDQINKLAIDFLYQQLYEE